jgi:membrane protease YdiL (CAAX protease family)
MLDWILAAYLLFVLPGMQLWKSLRKKTKDPNSDDPAARKARFWKNMRFILTPVMVMAILLAWSGRGPAAIGLDMPVSIVGQWALLGVVVLFTLPYLVGLVWKRKKSEEEEAKELADLQALELVPKSRTELGAFVLLMFCIGTGWELLYRGFLMLVLPPVTGLAGAVILSALAYGIGHGYQNWKQFTGSIVSAFLFTLGYVLTYSLWWLMLLHVALPLFGILNAYFAINKSRKVAAA